MRTCLFLLFVLSPLCLWVMAEEPQPVNTWVKRTPLANTPASPRLGYEGACVWDSSRHVMIRYGGHNQGGGGEQNSEVWSYDPATRRWDLHEPNLRPPGICCGQQNVFDPDAARYVRFPAFSGSHGWQWFREIYLNNTSVWTWDPRTDTFRNLRPIPEPRVSPLRCAAWDTDNHVVVLFGGEGNHEGTVVYDPYSNEWTWMKPKVQPEFRSAGNMAYDQARHVFVLFGAQFSNDPHTWIYDLRKNEWRDAQPDVMPPTNKNDAVLTYDSWNRRVLCLVKVTEGEGDDAKSHLETWAYAAGKNQWQKMNPPHEPDSSGNRARQLLFAPELGLALLENRTKATESGEPEQQVWTYRLGDAPRPVVPPAASKLKLVTAADSATLTWDAAARGSARKYEILRAAGPHVWEQQEEVVATVDAATGTWQDKDAKPGTLYHYRVVSVDQDGHRGPVACVRTQTRIVEDGVVSVLSANEVQLAWKPPAAEDVAGYLVERAVVEVASEDQLKRLKSQTPPLAKPSAGAITKVGKFQTLTKKPIGEPRYIDKSIDLTKPQLVAGEPLYQRRFDGEQFDADGRPYAFAVYAYRVRAVNRLGVASGPSPAWLTIPSPVQSLFSKEEGTTCHLKWEPSPEQGLQGYRVYRMDGRFSKAAIPRLTPKPIRETTFSDPEAGKNSRRYYIVAVDALSQEGFPSAPTWHRREWARFYEPFVGEWHQ